MQHEVETNKLITSTDENEAKNSFVCTFFLTFSLLAAHMISDIKSWS